MYQEINITDNANAVAIAKERREIMDAIADLQGRLNVLDKELIMAVDGYKHGEVIRNTFSGKKYMVDTARVLREHRGTLAISYSIRPITQTGRPSQNTSKDQFGGNVERIGKTIDY